MSKRRSGRIVKTKSGVTGVIYNDEPLINGKQQVHAESGKLLCDPETLTVIGYID